MPKTCVGERGQREIQMSFIVMMSKLDREMWDWDRPVFHWDADKGQLVVQFQKKEGN
jgi:hypothetical protein